MEKLVPIHTDPHDAEPGEYVYRSDPPNGGPVGIHNWDFFHEVGENGIRCARAMNGREFVFDVRLQLWLRVA